MTIEHEIKRKYIVYYRMIMFRRFINLRTNLRTIILDSNISISVSNYHQPFNTKQMRCIEIEYINDIGDDKLK